MTQAQFADAIGVSTGRVCQIERGRGLYKPEVILKIARAYRVELARLGFSIEDLLEGDQINNGGRRAG